jgi:hypothetical protein
MSKLEYKEIDTPRGKIQIRLSISGFSEDGFEATTDFKLSEDFKKNLESDDSIGAVDRVTMYSKTTRAIGGFTDSDGSPGLPIADGLTTIYGQTSSGKTQLMKRMYENTDPSICSFIRFHEPEIPSMLSLDELFKAIYDFLSDNTKEILYIDSLRFFVFNTAGRRAAGKGGISSAFYSDLTALSVIASYLKKSIVVVVNPMTKDSKEMESIANSLEGSVSSVFSARSYGNFTVTSRDELTKRDHIGYTFSDDELECDVYTENETTDDHNDDVELNVDTQEAVEVNPPKHNIANSFANLFKY